MATLSSTDDRIAKIIELEEVRQQETVNLIASENYVNPLVRKVMSSVLTNKYAEGYPGKRYYAGCEYVDQAEILAIERCKKLFGAEHVNVQPHAGSSANLAAYYAVLNPGDTIMGMSLAEGGHLTHGHSVNFSGKFFKSVAYGVNPETEMLDFEAIARLAHEHKPKLIIAGASAYSRTIDFAAFAAIAKDVGAYFLADIAHIAGLVATGIHPTPLPYADFVTSTTHKTLRGPRGGLAMCKQPLAESLDRAIMPGTQGGPFMHTIAAKAVAFGLALESDFLPYQQQIVINARTCAQAFQERGYRIVAGGTDNHMFVLDLRVQNITGRKAEVALESAGITVSRSCIPRDPEKPWITSGIRIGTSAMTTRGMREAECLVIVDLIDAVIKDADNATTLAQVRQQIRRLCAEFPLF